MAKNVDLILSLKVLHNKASKSIKDFRKEIEKTDKATDDLSGKLGKIGKLSGLAVAGVSALAGGMFVAAKAAIETADAIGKAADVADISTDTLQELRYAFDLFGISQQQTDEGLRRFARRLGEFTKSGGGPAKAAFDQMGLSSQILNGSLQGTETTLNEVIRVLGSVESQAQKSALAAQLFGDDAGPKLALALGKGIDEINNLRMEARNLGIVIGEDFVRGAEKANDQLTIANKIITAAWVQTWVDWAPAIVKAAEALSGVAKWMRDLNNGISSFARKDVDWLKTLDPEELDRVAAFIEERFVRFSYARATLQEQMDSLGEPGVWDWISNSEQQQKFNELEENLETTDRMLVELKRQLKSVAQARKELGTPLKGGGGGAGGLLSPGEIKAAAAAEKEFEDAVKASEEAVKKENEEYVKWRESMKEAAKEVKKTVDPTYELNLELEKLNKLLAAGDINWDEWAEATMQVQEAMDKTIAGTEEAANKTTEFWKEAARNTQDFWGDTFFSWMQGQTKDLVGDFKMMIDKMVAELLASKLLNFLVGDFGSTGNLGGVLAGMFRADGGPVMAGQPYIVGERGPELMVPQTNGTIVPNGAMGGMTINIHNSYDGAYGDSGLMQAIERNNRSIAETVTGAARQYRLGAA